MMFSLTANDEPAAERHEHAAAATTAGNITLRTNVWEAYVDKMYWILPVQDMFFLKFMAILQCCRVQNRVQVLND